jgi:hypothetical protein
VSISQFLGAVARVILNPLIILGFVVAILYFFWGIFNFVSGVGDEKGREEGKRSIMWGLIGMFVMVSVFGIIKVILNTFGIPTSGYVSNLLN